MKEDAVSPVIAAMLLLALIVTFLSAWNAILLPSLKQESEISHLREVETGFLRFSSDIGTAASLKTNLYLSERIPLGGGEVLLSSLRSGGMVRIRQEPEEYLSITDSSGNEIVHAFFSDITYSPVGNFWQNQGYNWTYGYTNVTNGEVQTPLEYSSMDSVEYPLASSLLSVDSLPAANDDANCSVITIKSVDITPAGDRTMVSGNGIATLQLRSSVNATSFPDATGLSIRFSGPEKFRIALNESASEAFGRIPTSCSNIRIQYPAEGQIDLVFDSVPRVTVRREITEISLSVT